MHKLKLQDVLYEVVDKKVYHYVHHHKDYDHTILLGLNRSCASHAISILFMIRTQSIMSAKVMR